jgi:hypothetical protein
MEMSQMTKNYQQQMSGLNQVFSRSESPAVSAASEKTNENLSQGAAAKQQNRQDADRTQQQQQQDNAAARLAADYNNKGQVSASHNNGANNSLQQGAKQAASDASNWYRRINQGSGGSYTSPSGYPQPKAGEGMNRSSSGLSGPLAAAQSMN